MFTSGIEILFRYSGSYHLALTQSTSDSFPPFEGLPVSGQQLRY